MYMGDYTYARYTYIHRRITTSLHADTLLIEISQDTQTHNNTQYTFAYNLHKL